MFNKKLPRQAQIDFIQLWANLKQSNLSDKAIITGLRENYLSILGICDEVRFCDAVIDELQNWTGGLHQAMKGYFDEDLILLVQTTGKSTNTSQAIKALISQTMLWNTLRTAVLWKFVLSIVIIAVTLLIFVALCTVGIHFVVGDFDPTTFGQSVLALIAIGDFLNQFGFIILLLLALMLTALIWALFTYTGEHRQWMDRNVPFYGFYSANEAASFFTLLNVMVTNGNMPLRKSLEELQNSGLVTTYINSHIDEMLYRLEMQKATKENEALTFQKLNTGLLPPILQLRLTGLEQQDNKEKKSNILNIISAQLATDYGAELLKKASAFSRTSYFICGISLLLIAATLLNALITKASNMSMGMGA